MICAAGVAAGMALGESVLPLDRAGAAVACAGAAAVTVGDVRAWPLVALTLGMFRGEAARSRFVAHSIHAPARFEGTFEVESEEGSGYVVRVGARRFLVSDPPPDFPAPGRRARALMRLDPIRSRAEPSAFRAERWAAARALNGRARLLSRVEGVEEAPGAGARLRRAGFGLRDAARRRLGFGRSEGGDLSTALLLGDRRGLEADIRSDFRHAGLAHVLALSGAHLAVLALGLATLLRVLRLPRIPVILASLAFVVGYTVLTGAAPPLVRACATVALATVADLAGRRSHAVSALGWAGAVLLLARPAWRHDTGFRLSFLATAVLVLFASRPAAPAAAGWRGRMRALGAGVALSTLVTLGTVPELASSFGRVSLLAPATNLLAGPPSAAALGWGGLAAFAPWPEGVADALAAGAERASAALLAIVHEAGRWPGGDLAVPALPAGASLVLLAVVARLAAGGRATRAEGRVLLAALAAAGAACVPRDRLTVLDVGQGDAILLEGGGGAVLVDAGPPGPDGLEAPVGPAVRRRRIRPLDALVVTHGHLDHVGGAADLLREGAFRDLVMRVPDGSVPEALDRLARDVAAGGSGRVAGVRGAHERLAGRLVVRAPFPQGTPPATEENDRSLATTWRARRCAANLLGDGGPAPQASLRVAGHLRPAPVLVLPHHGAGEATDDALLRAARPRLAIASCGSGNAYGHPHAGTIRRVREAGAALLRTDRDGTIAVTATRGGFRVRWTRDWPGPRRLFPPFALPEARGFP
jgi:competence protein ComEC